MNAGARTLLASLTAFSVACAAEGPASEVDDARWLDALAEHEPPGGAVVVRLAFGSEADLDLYVTGPREETVYFANTPSKIGGRLEADRRCGTPGPRVETVVFPTALPGRYRVGVDFPEACDGSRRSTTFSLEIRSTQGRSTRAGRLAPGEFDPIVFEWSERGD